MYITGGGFSYGSGNYPEVWGDSIAKLNVIFIGINVRVGPLGFMPYDDKATGGMNGIAD